MFYVDDVKAIHKDTKVVENVEQWIYFMYVDTKIGRVKPRRGKVHEYFFHEFMLHYIRISKNWYAKVSETMLDEFLIKIEKSHSVASLETENLFNVDRSNTLHKNKTELLYTTVARGLFLCKIYRPDINHTIAVLCTRVKHSNQGDRKNLSRLMKHVVGTQ